MRSRWFLSGLTIFVACVGAAISAAAAQQTSTPAPAAAAIPYDEFCGKSRMEKQALFKTMTDAHKASLWRTQIERWRDANRIRLNASQLSVIADMLAFLPKAVARPMTPAVEAEGQILEGRLRSGFTEAEVKAMDNYGPCIPKTK